MRTGNISRSSTVLQHVEIPSLCDLMASQLKRTGTKRRTDGRQALANRKIRDGSARACGALEEALLDEFAAGMTRDQALAFVGVFRRWVLMQAGELADVRDLQACSLAEQKAQSALDPMQLAAFDIAKATDADLEAMQPRADWDAEASAQFAYAIDVELVRRHFERQLARQALHAR